MAKPNLRLVPPNSELRTVTLRRRSNSEMGRDRERLTELEVERLVKVAKGTRHGHRDATMRVSELCDLQWSSIELGTGTMHVRRAKAGQEATHPLLGDELRAEAPVSLTLCLRLGAWWSVHPVGLRQTARPQADP